MVEHRKFRVSLEHLGPKPGRFCVVERCLLVRPRAGLVSKWIVTETFITCYKGIYESMLDVGQSGKGKSCFRIWHGSCPLQEEEDRKDSLQLQ